MTIFGQDIVSLMKSLYGVTKRHRGNIFVDVFDFSHHWHIRRTDNHSIVFVNVQ